MFTGVQILEPRTFEFMPNDRAVHKFSTTKHTYPRMLLQEEKLYGFRFDGWWQDLGTVDRIQQAEAILAGSRLHYLSSTGPHNFG
jgi:NDP-sugar pyrophosphorylase family protein